MAQCRFLELVGSTQNILILYMARNYLFRVSFGLKEKINRETTCMCAIDTKPPNGLKTEEEAEPLWTRESSFNTSC